MLAVIAITAIATVLTTTTANPLVLGAIKKGAIPFGTWLVSAIGEGLVGQALSNYWAKATDQVAYATVHGAQYVSNEYKQKSESKSGSKWVTDWETLVDMGREDQLESQKAITLACIARCLIL